MTKALRWGIIGTGNIAHQFARGLQAVPSATLMAVASRTDEKANKFGDEFDIPHRHGSYQALADDPDVDAVYVATPHTSHQENTMMCLNAGKHVLCEKPFAVNTAQAKEMVALAREKNLFLMDAVWTRFFPVMVKVCELLAEGAVGEVIMVHVDFGFRLGNAPADHRLLNPELAGGALLDVGIYPVQFASMVFGQQPTEILSNGYIGETGVDEIFTAIFGYGGNKMATLSSAIRLNTPHEARIMGTDGYISIPDWWHPTQFTLHKSRSDSTTYTFELEGNGYNYEAVEVADCVEAGKIESDVMPLDETLALMETMDKMRAQWGLVYPFEK